MKFLQRFAKAFGMITVKEIKNGDGGIVRVTGVDGDILRNHFKRLFETDAISKQMFFSITDTSFTINSFFIPDLIYMLAKLREDEKTTWSGRRTIDKIVEGLTNNTWFKCSIGDVKPIIDMSRTKVMKWNPMPKQIEFLHLFGDKMPRYDLRGYILGFAPGGGKSQCVDADILTTEGWIKMGAVTYDTKVIVPDGSSVSVTGIYPQGMLDIYRITLEGGLTAECSDDHLWRVYYSHESHNWNVVSLHNMRHSAKLMYLPVYDPVNKTTNLKRIVSINWSRKALAQCISVDHPDRLYITNDYIVTHNTFADLLIAECVIPPEVAEIKIIISPKKALHLVWEKTINSVFKKVPSYWCCDSGVKMPYEKCEYYIFNFEQLDRAIELGEALLRKGKQYFVLVDESHNFADYRSARTQKLVKLQTLRDDIMFLWTSGTPILKSAAELISYLKCADKRFNLDAEQRFKKIYSNAPGRANEIFNHRLGKMMAFIVGKSAFMNAEPIVKELPVKLPPSLAHKFLMSTVREDMKAFIEIRLDFYKDQIKSMRKTVEYWLDYHEARLTNKADQKAFKEYQKNLKIIMRTPDMIIPEVSSKARTYERTKLLPSLPPLQRKNFRNALSATKNLKLKVRGEALGTVLAKRRSECAEALGIYCKPEQIMKESLSKTLFFASSVKPMMTLERYLTKKGYEPVLVWAGTNSELTKNINRFTEDPNVNPVCATMQSLSEAVPVTAASTVVLLNRPFRQSTWDQVIGRALRADQPLQVTVVEVTLDTGTEPNVSSTTDAILTNVRELINELMGEEFAGPPLEDRVYQEAIDASKDNTLVELDETKLGL